MPNPLARLLPTVTLRAFGIPAFLAVVLLAPFAAAVAQETEGANDSATSEASTEDETPPPPRRPDDGETTQLELDGQKVSLQYMPLETGSIEHERFQSTGDGDVFWFDAARCFKFKTDVTLRHASGATIEAHNVHPEYPGIYCLWLVRDDGWQLLFNEQADVWGSMHDSRFDRARVPLTWGEAEENAPELDIRLSKDNNGSVALELAWGRDRGHATFTVDR